MRIGIFDSGRGGEFVAEELRSLLPAHEYSVVNDRKHVPYGSRSNQEIIDLTDAAIQPLLSEKCPIIVIACNTATMAAIATLRKRYPATTFIGIEPMLKPASLKSQSQNITVLATPLTLKSTRYRNLKHTYAANMHVNEPDTAGWASLIESDRADEINFSEVKACIASGSDVIVLACTHYHLLAEKLFELFPRVTLMQPTRAIAQQVERVAEGLR